MGALVGIVMINIPNFVSWLKEPIRNMQNF